MNLLTIQTSKKLSVLLLYGLLLSASCILYKERAAVACPSCKTTLAVGDSESPNTLSKQEGFNVAILFLLGLPFSLVLSFASFTFYKRHFSWLETTKTPSSFIAPSKNFGEECGQSF